MSTKLGHLLVAEGLLSEQDRKTIHEASGSTPGAFAKGILALGLLGDDELAAFIADRTHFRVAAKDIFSEVDDRALGAIDTPLLRQLEVLPLRLDSNVLAVGMIDPLDRATVHQIEFFTGCKVRPLIATLKQVRTGLARLIPGYQPTPSPFEVFMSTHMGTLRTGLSKKGTAKDLVSRIQPQAAPRTVANPSGIAGTTPIPTGAIKAAAPVNPATGPMEDAMQPEPAVDADEAAMSAPEPAVDLGAAAVSAAMEPAETAPPDKLTPDFGIPPAMASNEAVANKALLTLNKRILDISVQDDAPLSLKTLVDGLFMAGIEAGCVAIRPHGDSDGGATGAIWSGADSVPNAALGELRGELTDQLMGAITTYAPDTMESDGWIQIKADDAPSVKVALDLIEPGEARSAIETALMTVERVLLTRAFKLQTKPSDLVAILVWPNASAGHEALRASVSNALRAYAQKVDKS